MTLHPRALVPTIALTVLTTVSAEAQHARKAAPNSTILVYPGSGVTSAQLWVDAGAMWVVDGQDVLRAGRRVFTLPEGRIVSTAAYQSRHPASKGHTA